MNWFELVVIAGVASNIFNIYNRSSLKDQGDSSVYAWWFEVFRLIIFGVIFLLSPVFPTNPTAYLWLLILGLVEVVSVYLYMRSHQLTELSLSTFVIKLQLIWTPIMAWIFLGEVLSIKSYGAILVILAGIYLAVSPQTRKKDKGVMITLLSSAVISVLALLMKKSAGLASTSLLMVMMSMPSVIILPILMKQARKRIQQTSKNILKNGLAGVTANAIGMYLYVAAMRLESASKVVAVYQSMMVVAVIFGVVFLKEKQHLKLKLIGMGIVILGLGIIGY